MQSPELGEVYIVGVDLAAQGRGLGRLLTLAGLYLSAGVSEVMLYVEGDNTRRIEYVREAGFYPVRSMSRMEYPLSALRPNSGVTPSVGIRRRS